MNFPVGPSRGSMNQFGRQNNGMNRFRRPAAPGLNPGQPAGTNKQMINGPAPIGIDNGMSTGGITPPRMPQIQPNLGMSQPGMPQGQYSPMMPSNDVINKFISPQPGSEGTINMGGGGFAGGAYTLPWQRRLF